MNTYTNVFGGENVNPAELSYKAYGTIAVPITADLELNWPFEALDGTHIVADKIDVIAGPGVSIFLPDATLASVGEDILWNNVGGSAFTVVSYTGATIITVQPGAQWFTYLISNTTQAGTWRVVQFGTVTPPAVASALAGMGLRARGEKIDQDLLTETTRNSGDQTLADADRAKVFRNEGGDAVYTLDSASGLDNGWFVITINAGDGNLTLTPTGGELIDKGATKVLAPNESCVVYSYGTGFATMGHGRAQSASGVTPIDITSGGSGTMTLSVPQVAAQIQNYVGVLSGARTIIYGPGTGYWFVYNKTTGAFPLSVQGAPLDTPAIVIPQNTFTILRSYQGALDIAFSAATGTMTSITAVATELTASPNPITTTGTIGLANMPSGPGKLEVGTYGTATNVAQLTVEAKGRISKVANVAIGITASQITDLTSLFPPGTIIAFAGVTLPPGTPPTALWLPCDGTVRLKTDFPALSTALGTTYNTGGELGTQFRLPDTRGRVMAGLDPGAGAGAGRLTSAWFGGINPATLGVASGTQSHLLTNNQLPNHQHKLLGGAIVAGGLTTQFAYADGTSFNDSVASGGMFGAPGEAHHNVQPTLIIRHLIKT